jgi:hypothetical protein
MQTQARHLKSQAVIAPLLACILWLVASLSPQSSWPSLLASVVTSFACLRWTWMWLGCPEKFTALLLVCGNTLPLLVNLGYAQAWFVNRSVYNRDIIQIFASLDIEPLTYALAMAYIGAFSFVIAALGGTKFTARQERIVHDQLVALREQPESRIKFLTTIATGLAIFLIVSGVIRYQGTSLTDAKTGETSPAAFLVQALAAVMAPLSALLWTKLRANRRGDFLSYIILVGSVVSGGFIAFTGGRRALLSYIVTAFLFAVFSRGVRPKPLPLVATLVGTAIAFNYLSLLFNFVRWGSGASSQARETAASEVIAASWSKFGEESDDSKIVLKSAQNLATRPLVAHPLANLIGRTSNGFTPLLGQDLISSAAWSIPRVIFPGKVDIPVQEQLLNGAAGKNYKDTADSIYLSSYLDFGILGCIVHPLFLIGIWLVGLRILMLAKDPFVMLLLYAPWPMIFTIQASESSTITWFVALRSAASILLLIALFRFLWTLFASPTSNRNDMRRQRVPSAKAS